VLLAIGDRMKFGNTIPIIRSFDESKAKEFYIDFLDFNLDWEHRFEEGLPLYMQISKDGCVLHISEHHGDCSPGAAVRIETDNLERYHQLLISKEYKYAKPGIQDMPWGGKDMTISDPFGNRITFAGAIST
jgi:uncharacterized glyoxalase superfamily protein PhnB